VIAELKADASRQLSQGITVIDGSRSGFTRRIGEYRRYRTLFLFLALRDVMLRYRQTVLGVVWAIVQPILPMLIFAAVLARVLRPGTGGVPYPLFALAGLTLWTFFANAITASGSTFMNNHNLLNKVYFPRAILPAAAVAAHVVDLLVAGALLLGLALWWGYRPTVAWLFVPLIGLLTAALAMAVGVALASLMAMYRDVKYLLPFLVQIWMYATPVIYPTSVLAAKFHWAIGLNPMTGVVEAFRASLFGTPADWSLIGLSSLSAAIIAIGGWMLFQHLEADLAERV
jgi:homopolymeric O-antigen transport system permease protein